MHNFYSEPNNLMLTSEINLQHGKSQNLIRNPFNILWCHVLVFIRNMNSVYLENEFDDTTTENYLSKLVHMLNS